MGGVLVVGGASGIGAAIVERYAAAGREVVVWDIAGAPDVACDATDPAQVDAAMALTVARIGPPAEVTITAGIGHGGLLSEIEPKDWDRVMAINTKGPWLVMRSAARALRAAGAGGSIVATSSVSARIPDRAMGAYCASKAALSMVVRVAAAEWAPAIRVNGIAPGVTDTPMLGGAAVGTGWLRDVADRTALGRIGTAGEIADAALALHGMGWVTGQIVEVDGGLGLHSPISPPFSRPAPAP